MKYRKQKLTVSFDCFLYCNSIIYSFSLLLKIDLWALDERGHPLPIWNDETAINAAHDSSWSHSFYKFMESYITSSVAERQTISKSLKQELTELYNKMDIEKFKFQFLKTENSKNKRLLFLFQMDLLPGMTGEILNSKEQRDNVMLLPVSGKIKVISWAFLALLNFGMLFYVFLFAIRQNIHRQSAWAKSLAMYLFLDILLISSCMVIFMHILLPSIVMRDVVKIRKKLTETVSKYYHDLAAEQDAEDDDEEDGSDGEEDVNNPRTLHLAMNKKYARKVSSSTTNGAKKQPHNKKKKSKLFNSAKYLFLSYRMAECYPDLKASKIILQYQSPWPRQSYQHTIDMKKDYKYSYTTALSRSISIIVIFLLTSLLASPLAVQDMFLQMAATVTMGYMILLHIQLFRVFPILVLVPSAVIGVVVMAGYLIYSSHYPSSELLRKAQEEEDRSNSELSLTGSDEENHHHHDNLKKVIAPATTTAIIPIVANGRVPPVIHSTHNNSNNNNNKQQQTRRQSMQYGLQLTSQIKDILSDEDDDEEEEEKETEEEKEGSEEMNRQRRRHSHSKTKENYNKKKKTEIESKESDDDDSEENKNRETTHRRKAASSESEEKEEEQDEEDGEEDDEENNHSAFNSDISDENFEDEQDVLITKFLSIKMGNGVEKEEEGDDEDEEELSDDEEDEEEEEEEEQSRSGTERSQNRSRERSSSNHSSSRSRRYSSSDRRKDSILSQSEGKETRSSDENDHEDNENEEEQEDRNSSEEKHSDSNSSEDNEKDNRSVESMQSSSSEENDSDDD
jgi:hypothetical protein